MLYLDHHSTTPCDRRVVEAMLPWFTEQFGNPHSHTHAAGRTVAAACDAAAEQISNGLGTTADSLIITSGATESNNLAIDGVMRHPRQKRRHLITVTSEHPAVLEPAARLQRDGFRVTFLPVLPQQHERCGQIDLEQLASVLDDDTALVSVMWANNEIGVVQPIAAIAAMVHRAGALFHTDATQAVGRLAIDIGQHDIDLLSASAHKFYGPKGIGLLALGSQRRVRLMPSIVGGGQQRGLRSGTLNAPGVIGMATALQISLAEREPEQRRLRGLRDRLWSDLQAAFPTIELNGPALETDATEPQLRLVENLNVSLTDVEGESLMAAASELAISSGAACSSVDPRPSHVLTAIGLSESRARRSLRFGLGRGTTAQEIDTAVAMLVEGHRRLVGAR